jgi:hypothetical protein
MVEKYEKHRRACWRCRKCRASESATASSRATPLGRARPTASTGIVEKPQARRAPSNLGWSGAMCSARDLRAPAAHLRAAAAARSSSPMPSPACIRRRQVLAYRFSGTRFDCGSKRASRVCSARSDAAERRTGTRRPRRSPARQRRARAAGRPGQDGSGVAAGTPGRRITSKGAQGNFASIVYLPVLAIDLSPNRSQPTGSLSTIQDHCPDPSPPFFSVRTSRIGQDGQKRAPCAHPPKRRRVLPAPERRGPSKAGRAKPSAALVYRL